MGRDCSFLQGADTDFDQITLLKQAVEEQKEVFVTVKNYCKMEAGSGSAMLQDLFLINIIIALIS